MTKTNHQFQIIQFGEEVEIENKIVIILTLWVEDEKTSYMKPLFEGENAILIEDLIKIKSAAPASWPKYAFKFLLQFMYI